MFSIDINSFSRVTNRGTIGGTGLLDFGLTRTGCAANRTYSPILRAADSSQRIELPDALSGEITSKSLLRKACVSGRELVAVLWPLLWAMR